MRGKEGESYQLGRRDRLCELFHISLCDDRLSQKDKIRILPPEARREVLRAGGKFPRWKLRSGCRSDSNDGAWIFMNLSELIDRRENRRSCTGFKTTRGNRANANMSRKQVTGDM